MKKEDFDRIYMEYHKLVQHVAFDILQDHNLAQDVCQEVFIKLHQKIERLDENLIKGWILRNTHGVPPERIPQLPARRAEGEKSPMA